MERMQEPVRVPSQSNQARSIPVALTPQHHHKAMQAAADQMLVGHVRKLKSLVDSHLSEQAFNSVEAGAPYISPSDRHAWVDCFEDSSSIHDGYDTKLQQRTIELAMPVAQPVGSGKVAAAPASETA